MTAGRTNHTQFAAGPTGDDLTDSQFSDLMELSKRALPPIVPLRHCASDCDGDCRHPQCPQLRDNEPHATGRSCPLYDWEDRRI